MDPQTTIFIVDDDDTIRTSLQLLVESTGIAVKTYPSATQFLEAYHVSQPGCIVADIQMPGMSGMELQAQLNALQPAPAIIFLSGHGDIAMAARAMRAGAIDFIEKPFSGELLLERIRSAIRLDAARHEKHAARSKIASRFGQLTPRETEIMTLVVNGLSNRLIASKLKLSEKTIEAHRAGVMKKTEAGSLAELVRMTVMLQDGSAPVFCANGAA